MGKFESLKELLTMYKENTEESPIVLSQDEWTIAEGGYDLWWEIYYNGISAVRCIRGEFSSENCTGLDCADRKKAEDVVADVLTYLRRKVNINVV